MLGVNQMFRGADTPEDVQRVAKLDAGSIDYLGVDFFSEVFLGLYHDAHGNEVMTSRRVVIGFGLLAYSNVALFGICRACSKG